MRHIFPALPMRHWRGDVYGGLTTAVVALPLSLAFGIASGLGAAAGLYSAIILGFFAALWGGAPAQISGPNGPMTVVMASIIAMYPQQPELSLAAVMLSGMLLMLAGGFRLGQYINLVPYPVISGFMTGVGMIIILLQLATLSGHSGDANIPRLLGSLPAYWGDMNFQALALGLISLGIVIFTPKFLRRIAPSPLWALVIGSLLGIWYFHDAPNIGPIPGHLPVPHWPDIGMADWLGLLLPGLMLASLCAIDSLMTATVADRMTRQQHDSNRELWAQGAGNFLAGLFGGIAGSGATMRTTVNIQNGGRTPLSGMLHAVILLSVLLGLGDWAQYIPHAVLAGILLKVGFDIIDWRFLCRLHRLPLFVACLTLIVIGLTIGVDLLTAVIAGVSLAAIHWIQTTAMPQLSVTRPIGLPQDSGIRICHIGGNLHFGGANQLSRQIGSMQDCRFLILDGAQVSGMDLSTAIALGEVIQQHQEYGITVCLAGLSPAILQNLLAWGDLQNAKKTLIAADIPSAIAAIQATNLSPFPVIINPSQ